MRRRSIALGIAAGIVAALPGTAVAAGVDQRSDQAALTAYHAYLEGVTARIPAAKQLDSAFVSSISDRCAGTLAPLTSASAASINQMAVFDFGEELGGSVDVVASGAARGELSKMATTLKKLHWSSPRSANTIKHYFAAEDRLFRLAPGDVCTDARALVASQGETIPPGTSQWLGKFEGDVLDEADAAQAFGTMLKEFESPADRGLAASDNRLLRSLTRRLQSVETAGATQAVRALGL
ncbi:MAG TPA: hypothetical protein VMJ65_21090 [Solirubrobacteraceae bacterium]|nr:hypothetical protein [Solirubrobacteraceae bacterium]